MSNSEWTKPTVPAHEAGTVGEPLDDTAQSLRSEGSDSEPVAGDDMSLATELAADLVRLQADFENYRKRTQRDLEAAVKRGEGQVISELLAVLDALDAAEGHAEGSEAASLVAVKRLLVDALEKRGLVRVGEVGEGFDPHLHDALGHEPGEGGPTIVSVLRVGYCFQGTTLRPALVNVRG